MHKYFFNWKFYLVNCRLVDVLLSISLYSLEQCIIYHKLHEKYFILYEICRFLDKISSCKSDKTKYVINAIFCPNCIWFIIALTWNFTWQRINTPLEPAKICGQWQQASATSPFHYFLSRQTSLLLSFWLVRWEESNNLSNLIYFYRV